MWLLVDKSLLSTSRLENMEGYKKFYVVPESQDGDGVNCNETECHPLAFYMNHSRQHPSPYFNSQEKYIFLNGKHAPLANTTVVIKQKTNLTFMGFSFERNGTSAIIDCNGESVGFVFMKSSNITIESLTFSLCIRTSTGTHHPLATLAFEKGFNLILTRVTLQGSVDEAIFIKDIKGIIHFREISIENASSQVSRNMNAIFNSECDNDDSLRLIIEDSTFVRNFMPASNDSNNVNIDNHPLAAGLSITLQCLNVSVEIDNVTMLNNEGGNGGGLALVFHNTSSIINNTVTIRNSVFESGKADVGAGLFVEFIERSESEETACFHSSKNEHQLLFVENTTFKNNSAVYAGGAIYLKQKQSWASCSVGRISFVNCTFQQNFVTRKGFGGTALHSINYPITGYRHHGVPQFKILLKMCNFSENYAEPHNVSQSGNGVIFTKFDSSFELFDVKITNNNSSGILAIGSNIILSGSITIKHNQGSSGGGLLLCENAVIYFDVNSTVVVTYNQVRHTGGGISVETQCLQSRPMCFFQLTEKILNDPGSIHTVKVLVHNNTAGFAGHNLFGGSVDHCFMLDRPNHHQQPNKSIDIYRSIFHTPKYHVVPSSVTSEPRQVCLCENGRYECSTDSRPINFEQYPGQRFTLKAVLVGQLYGIVPGTVQAWIKRSDSFASLNKRDKVQKLGSNSSCGNLTYTVYSNGSVVELHLGAQHSGDESGYEQLNNLKKLKLNVTVKKCPPGFELFTENDQVSCECVGLLRQYSIKCNIGTQSIRRERSFWIGYNNNSETTLLHPNCPFEYCVNTVKLLNTYDIVLTNNTSQSSQQCAHNRTGMLCGTCMRGLSVMLGSCQCQVCSNYWLLIIIVIALSGVLLVFILTAIDMTITEGTISGVLFYCNIINSSITTFFAEPNYPFISSLLKNFVSSLSLTLGGIPMCLYNGLNAYSVAWLSFTYPFYIWLIAGLLICLGHKFNWLVRHNSVKVLATLVILSYSSLLHAVIEALQPTYMHHDHGKGSYLWLRDGSIRYFVGKHIPLVIFASSLGLILLPFSVCLLFIQCLFKVSHYRLFSWVNRLKPFFDAYTGPFTSKSQFWTGLLLLARIFIYTLSAANVSSNRVTNIAIIGVISFVLLFISSVLKGGLYKQRSLTILEQSFMLNLGLLSVVTIGSHDKPAKKIVTHLCIGVAFITFVGIILHHVKFVRRPIRCICSRIVAIITTSRSSRVHYDHLSDEDNDDQGMGTDMFPPLAQFDQSREPLLD